MTTPSASTAHAAEPWLRGTHTDLPPVLRAVLHAFELAQEDVRKWAAELTEAELNATPAGLTPLAFHLRHIPGTLDRLLTYAEGRQLSTEQLTAMKAEATPTGTRDELFAAFDNGLAAAARRVRAFAGADLSEPRLVGRRQLPASLGGIMVHLADHTQRHTGQIVTTAKLLKATRAEGESLVVHGLK
jgi:uncharacterized damage-inducible protein DinB